MWLKALSAHRHPGGTRYPSSSVYSCASTTPVGCEELTNCSFLCQSGRLQAFETWISAILCCYNLASATLDFSRIQRRRDKQNDSKKSSLVSYAGDGLY